MMADDEPGGGQPQTQGEGASGELPPVPTGIQKLLRLASLDEAFRKQLVDHRDKLAAAAGVQLTASERAMLAAIPAAQLSAMAEKMPLPPAPRRDFLRQSAATAVVLLGGAALGESLSACKKGHDPDAPERPRRREMEADGGAAPDLPAEPPEEDAGEPEPPRPDHREMESEGGAAPDEPE